MRKSNARFKKYSKEDTSDQALLLVEVQFLEDARPTFFFIKMTKSSFAQYGRHFSNSHSSPTTILTFSLLERMHCFFDWLLIGSRSNDFPFSIYSFPFTEDGEVSREVLLYPSAWLRKSNVNIFSISYCVNAS